MIVAALLLNSALVAVAVLIHFEALNQLTIVIPKLSIRHRFRVLVGIFGALLAHIIEILMFALGYYFMVLYGGFGSLEGPFNGGLIDCIYFSLVNYTSLGFGDIVPKGDVRFLAGIESLAGLVLISWTASFMFIEMQKQWRQP